MRGGAAVDEPLGCWAGGPTAHWSENVPLVRKSLIGFRTKPLDIGNLSTDSSPKHMQLWQLWHS